MIGQIELTSSYEPLQHGFGWAKEQALAYVHEDDPVGKWYDAALPNREAFCMRDVAHQSDGAHFLGLQSHNLNMLRKFAEYIHESRDYCSYWEINRYDDPAPVDYKNDQDFWYNLPANFDVTDSCYRQYNWTGDRSYITDPIFQNFYELTFSKYIARWDKDGDGIPEKQGEVPYRGIGSYIESQVGGDAIHIGSDLIAAMYAGYNAYAHMLDILEDSEGSDYMYGKALALKDIFETEWWSQEANHYQTVLLKSGNRLIVSGSNVNEHPGNITSAPLYFGLVDRRLRVKACLDVLETCNTYNVESLSHLPTAYYRYGHGKNGFDTLMTLMSPDLVRREYPEVSFSVIGSLMTGLLGFSANGTNKHLITKPNMVEEIEWIQVETIPVFAGTVDFKVTDSGKSQQLISTEALIWEVVFKGHHQKIHVNEKYEHATLSTDTNGHAITTATVKVVPNHTTIVSID